jgi:hypothetical protein
MRGASSSGDSCHIDGRGSRPSTWPHISDEHHARAIDRTPYVTADREPLVVSE